MTQPRSDEILLVGYYLARCSAVMPGRRSAPPSGLRAAIWGDAYDRFYAVCGDGRTNAGFRNSLRNTRDAFDALFANGRRGWVDETGAPLSLDDRCRAVHDLWRDRDDAVLERTVLSLLSP